ncbi:MAG TPA: hypothetical protein VF002_08790 [Gaiellaceae bacterium]
MGVRRFVLPLALFGFVCFGAGLGTAARPPVGARQLVSARPLPKMFGVVPASRHAGWRPRGGDFASTALASSANLSYHGGPVMHANRTYAIYWLPPGYSVSASYESLLNGFFQNVAAASGATSNVYATDTQYYDTAGSIAYSSAFGGAFVDTTTAIPNHCSGEYLGTGVAVNACVTDADVRAEVAHVLGATGWTPGPTSEFFVFTPRNVGSCFDTSSGTCAYTYYCAYHSNYRDSLARDVIYANQPYPDTSGVGAPGVCDSGQHPNNDWADAAINLISHEHNESITDPDGNAWYDTAGNEDGDKCAWNFGSALGSTAYGQYNQQIGSGKYYLQQEWSNASGSCALKYGTSPPPLQQPKLVFHGLATTFTAGSAESGTVQLETASGLPQTATSSLTVSLGSSGSGSFTPTAVTIPAGASTSPSFSYNDTKAESTSVTASASGSTSATQTETVTAGPATSIAVSPASATVAVGGAQLFTASGSDRYGNAANVAATSWSTSAPGSLSRTTGSSTSFAATSPGSGTLNATLGTLAAHATVSVTAPVLANGSFESGSLSGWTVGGNSPTPVISTAQAHSPTHSALLGYTGATGEPSGDSSIQQQFTVPAAGGTLSFYVWEFTTDTVQYDWQTCQLRTPLGATLATIFKEAGNARAWQQKTFSLTTWKAQPVVLWCDVHEDGWGDQTYMYADDFSVS